MHISNTKVLHALTEWRAHSLYMLQTKVAHQRTIYAHHWFKHKTKQNTHTHTHIHVALPFDKHRHYITFGSSHCNNADLIGSPRISRVRLTYDMSMTLFLLWMHLDTAAHRAYTSHKDHCLTSIVLAMQLTSAWCLLGEEFAAVDALASVRWYI